MTSYHHHLHQPPPMPAAISTCTTCYCSTAPPSSSPDAHLLRSLISLLQSPQNPSPNSQCQCASNPNHQPQHQIRHKNQTFGKSQPIDSATQAVLTSLVTRIDALESSLRRRSESCVYGSSSVREAAARVIQLHFRSYLVRRSRSLRHMKDLAFIKSRFNALKLSITDQARVDPVVVTRKTVDLLYKLDCIQDRDQMIVNGKKSLTRDLVGFLDYVDTIAVKRHGVVKQVSVVQSRSGRGKSTAFRGSGRDRRVVNVIETLRGQIDDEDEDENAVFVSSSEEEIPYVSHRVINKKKYRTEDGSLAGKCGAHVSGKKNVSFSDDGRNHNVEPKSKQNGDQREILESLRKRVEEMEAGLANGVQGDEDDESGSGASSQTSDSEISGTGSAAGADHKPLHQHHPIDGDDFTFPTTNHVKMESQASSQTGNLKIKS